MERTITVKGIGKAYTAPDLVVLPITLSAIDPVYENAAAAGAEQLEAIHAALTAIGFAKETIKTSDFDVSTEYETQYDKNGNCQRRLLGYRCSHRLQLSFELDMNRLSDVLQALTTCPAAPEISVQFTVRNKDAVHEEVLTSAARSARSRAEILCAASGVKLGQLLHIEDSWDSGTLYSPTRFAIPTADCRMAKSVDMTPEDICTEDTVTFVWELL